jgi:comEA protein
MKTKAKLSSILVALCLLLIAASVQAEDSSQSRGVVNINTASVDQLVLLPRIGPSTAQRVVDFRQENGRFKKPEELMLVQGIGERTFEMLLPYVTVDGETTLTDKVSPPRSPRSDDSGEE